jgi:hypothetical protein
MGPAKRKSTDKGKTNAKAAKGASAPDIDAASFEIIDRVFAANPWMTDLLTRFDTEWELHEDPIAILDKLVDKPSWATYLDSVLPPEESRDYFDAWPESAAADKFVFVRPYHLEWHKDSGNRGPFAGALCPQFSLDCASQLRSSTLALARFHLSGEASQPCDPHSGQRIPQQSFRDGRGDLCCREDIVP